MANNTGTGTRGKDETRTGNTGSMGGTTGGAQGGNQGGNQGGTTGVMDKARDVASNVVDRAKDMASNVADTARDWASTASDRASDAVGAATSGIGSLADTVRENMPGTEYVTDAIESGTRYFREHNFQEMTDDVAGIIRRNPIPAMLVGVGIGFLIARATTPRS